MDTPTPLREGVKKPIESVIMIIPGRGGACIQLLFHGFGVGWRAAISGVVVPTGRWESKLLVPANNNQFLFDIQAFRVVFAQTE